MEAFHGAVGYRFACFGLLCLPSATVLHERLHIAQFGTLQLRPRTHDNNETDEMTSYLASHAGRKVVQPATVVQAEDLRQSSRNASGLQSELSLSRQRNTVVRERDNVDVQARFDLMYHIDKFTELKRKRKSSNRRAAKTRSNQTHSLGTTVPPHISYCEQSSH
jgi:hypothetical protein